MRYPLLALLLLAAAETAALACSCIPPPRDAAERQRLAREVARGASALVEVELATPYDRRTGRGERLHVRRVLAGRASPLVELHRAGHPESAACDLVFSDRRRLTVLLYPHPGRAGRIPLQRVSSGCTTFLLVDAPFRQAVIAAMRSRL